MWVTNNLESAREGTQAPIAEIESCPSLLCSAFKWQNIHPEIFLTHLEEVLGSETGNWCDSSHQGKISLLLLGVVILAQGLTNKLDNHRLTGTWAQAWPPILCCVVLGLPTHLFVSCQLFSCSVLPVNLECHKVQQPLQLLSPPLGPDFYCSQLCSNGLGRALLKHNLVRWQYPVDTIPHVEAGVCLCLESGFDIDHALCSDMWTFSLDF